MFLGPKFLRPRRHRQRFLEHCKRLHLGLIAQRIDVHLEDAEDPDFLDPTLAAKLASKAEKPVRMGIQIAHFPAQKTLESFYSRPSPR